MNPKIMLERKYERTFLYQWDINMRLEMEGIPAGTQVDYRDDLAVKTYEEDGAIFADIPNILLQQPGELTVYVYLFDGERGYTLLKERYYIAAREKPADYVYTETDVLTWHELDKRIAELEKNPGGGSSGVSPEQVQEAVNAALKTAKDSGEFDGPPGDPGVSATHKWDGTVLTMTSASGTSSADLKGEPGYTPQKGVDYFDGAKGDKGDTPVKGEDYWTDADKQQIINDVLEQVGGGGDGASEDVYEVIVQWTVPAEWTNTMYTWSNLAHKKLIIIIEAEAGTAEGTIEFVWNWCSLGYTGGGIRSGVKSKSVCFVDTHLISEEGVKKRYLSAVCSAYGFESNTAQFTWNSRGYGLPGTVTLGANTAIDQITIRCAADNLLPEGSIVTILGVRA